MSSYKINKDTGSIDVLPDFPDIYYVEENPHPLQTMDIYLPNRCKGPYPTLVFIHGGGWWQGDKRSVNSLRPLEILNSGYAVASINYRLTPDGVWPNQIYDIRRAVKYLRRIGSRYNLKTDVLVCWGTSAGGHLAQMLGALGGRDFLMDLKLDEDGYSSSVQGVISMYGISELAELDHDSERLTGLPSVKHCDNMNCRPCQMTGFVIREDYEKAKNMGSVKYVNKDFPPILLQHGTGDKLVPWYQSEHLHQRIQEVCGADRSVLELFEGAIHGDPVFYEKDNMQRIIRFLDSIYNIDCRNNDELRDEVSEESNTIFGDQDNMITNIDKSKCIGCGTCERVCPLDTIRLGEDNKAYIAYPEDCMTCYTCELGCPQKAIYVHPFKEILPRTLSNMY